MPATFRMGAKHKFRAKPVWEVNGTPYTDKIDAWQAVLEIEQATGKPLKPLYFASKKEYARYRELMTLSLAGKISGLRRQVRFQLRGKSGKVIETYVCDFQYEENGKLRIEDCKGFRTPAYLRKLRWMASEHNIEVRET